MSQVIDGKFACGACGKRYAWKPQLAGKRAKCACGAAMTVPAAAAVAPASEPDDLYGMAEAAGAAGTVAPRKMAPPVPPAPLMAASTIAGVPPIAYRSAATVQDREADRFSLDRMTHPPRDLYVPVGLLLAGFLALLVWVIVETDLGATGMVIMSVVTGVATLFKLVVLIGIAMIVAPMLGISFGDFRTAVLKFAAIIVFTDAVMIWIQTFMEWGGGAPSRRMAGRMIWINLLATAAFISFLCHYLFDMDGEETGYFAIPMALLSWLMELVIGAVAAGVMAGLVAAAAGPAATPPAAPAAAAAPAAPAGAPAPKSAAPAPPPPGPVMVKNESDRQIVDMIEAKDPMVREANEYIERSILSDSEQRFARRLYNVGAVKIHFDLRGARPGNPAKAYVQLPDDPEPRARCFAVQATYAKEEGMTVDPAVAADVGQRFMIIEMKQPTPRRR
jgi:hypothetical protein